MSVVKNKHVLQADAFAKALKREGGLRLAMILCKYEPGENVLAIKIAKESGLSSTRAAEIFRMLEGSGIVARRNSGAGNTVILTVKDHDFRNFVKSFTK